jgi:hypothetical protein
MPNFITIIIRLLMNDDTIRSTYSFIYKAAKQQQTLLSI